MLLNRSDYTMEEIQKLDSVNSLFDSLYHDKKIMMIQVKFVVFVERSAIGCDDSESSLGPAHSVRLFRGNRRS